MKVTFFKGVSVSIYFMYLTQLSEKQTICSTPSLQIKQFSDIKRLFLQRFSLFQRKISFFECVSFLPLFLVKIQQRVIRNLKPERSLALQMNTSLARRFFIVKPNSHVQIFQLIYISVFLVVWTVSLHGNKPKKPVFIVMSNFQTWPEASGNCLLLKTYLTWCACLQQGLPKPNTW